MSEKRFRLRELGLKVGKLNIGKLNSITDVPGVKVGHYTIIEGEGALIPGKGPVRTGVTVIIPHQGNIFKEKIVASSFVMNGYGKAIGLPQIQELGSIESVIALTGTLNIPLVADALIDYHLEENPDIGIKTSTINVVVGECNDGYLNDMQGRHVRKEHVIEAIKNASSNVEEGAVGAGTGMVSFGYKAGIGTSSRKIVVEGEEYILGVLVLSNFGRKKDLTILGQKFHHEHETDESESKEKGSIMVVVATNTPLNSRQLQRIAKRAPLGITRTGSFVSWGSGDIIISFTTANKLLHDRKDHKFETEITNETSKLFNFLLKATVEATEEAILNSLLKANTMKGRDDKKIEAISIEKIKKILVS
ncbi:MAG: P1 family peptidase [Asgard group archaeon]|nr:P1 family peptidase [Asgard group archaeon]